MNEGLSNMSNFQLKSNRTQQQELKYHQGVSNEGYGKHR